MKETLNYLFGHNILSIDGAKNMLIKIGKGEFSEPEIASFLTVYMMRKITPDELAGFRMALLELSVPIDFDGLNTIDVCGTGGDEKNTFNISTLTSFVLAGAGIKVVKHGNYGVSSSCGSSNVLEHFGYKFSNEQDKLKKEIEHANICYLHAPLFHPAMKYVAPVRKKLKVKTFFNILGPMINPGNPKNQIIGVFSKEVQDLYNLTYKNLDVNYSIIYGLDGYDEISLTGDFRILTAKGDQVYAPSSLGMNKVTPEALFGGDTVEQAANILMDILDGKGTEAQENVVAANAAFAIKTMFPERDIDACVNAARESLQSKKALGALKKLIDLQ